MERIQETVGFINEVRRLTRDAENSSIIEDQDRKERLNKAHSLREEAEKDAVNEWPQLQDTIRDVAALGHCSLIWGVPEYAEREKVHYYCSHMMDILKQHGFEVYDNSKWSFLDGRLTISWFENKSHPGVPC